MLFPLPFLPSTVTLINVPDFYIHDRCYFLLTSAISKRFPHLLHFCCIQFLLHASLQVFVKSFVDLLYVCIVATSCGMEHWALIYLICMFIP